MSAESNGGGNGSEERLSSKVGYGKPPIEHRFKKGQSGNPRGRPRKVKPSGRRNDPEFGAQLANALLLEEAYRLVTVREGNKTFRLPLIQAAQRRLASMAVNGNRLALKTLIDLVQGVEAADRNERLENFEAWAQYKSYWEHETETAQRLRLPLTEPVPHQDDVILDFESGLTGILGPMTNQEKESWDFVLAHRTRVQAEVSRLAKACRKARSPRMKALKLEAWLHEQSRYDLINDRLPRRCRGTLEDRYSEDT
jgi:hypothetical protein